MLRQKMILLLAGILVCLLAGCGEQDENMENVETVETVDTISDKYTVESFSIETGYNTGYGLPLLAGTKVYYVIENDSSDYTLYSMDIDSGETVSRAISIEGRTFNLVSFAADQEGNIYYAFTIKPENSGAAQWDRYIMKQNAEGEEVYFQRITEEIGLAFLQMYVDEQGRPFFRYDKVYQFDENGNYLGQDDYVWDAEEAERFHQQAAGLEKFGIRRDRVRDIVFMEDGRIAVLASQGEAGSYELFVLTPSETSVNADKTELVLGVLQVNDRMRSLVADFNKSREDIYVTIREYQPSGGSRTSEEAVSVLMGDFLSGDGPDLIALSPGENHAALAEQGILEDLQPYVDQSSVIRQEDFLPNVWELGRQGDLLYAVPLRFALQTLAGKAGLLGERDVWTVEELMALAAEYPESLLVDPLSSDAVFSLCCNFQAEAFIDREAAECDFDQPLFYEMLEFAGSFAPDGRPDSVSDPLKYQDGSVLLMEAELYNALSFLVLYQEFGTTELDLVGYPTGDGSPGHILSQSGDMYGISSRSEHKQEAWEFVEYHVRWEGENTRMVFGFPADRGRLEQYFAAQADAMGLDSQQAEELGEEVLRVAEEAVKETGWGEETAILLEEVSAYFSGQKSVEDTVDAIQNRVGLYLKERQ
ncbi:MAG: extracellular solute-binding protein [Eubacterium sp.]|nr:extracellular solute-binding protein [Eubacterium sp.]MCM1302978.1 extracellular solute-binding protein [Butyrivibrio sp.]MCM1344900.1 extracellular solute-binding protein [Muribaculaceae bacterium]MCM1412059.1 extracellular solute-binding protein [Lachnospiraceae bacterium]